MQYLFCCLKANDGDSVQSRWSWLKLKNSWWFTNHLMFSGCTSNASGTRLHKHELLSQLWACCYQSDVNAHVCMFRWSGRNHREKIGVHVQFEQELNMEPYCCKDSSNLPHPQHFLYQLSAVVMHHGKGFGSGHYTAFCYNKEGGKTLFFSSATS